MDTLAYDWLGFNVVNLVHGGNKKLLDQRD